MEMQSPEIEEKEQTKSLLELLRECPVDLTPFLERDDSPPREIDFGFDMDDAENSDSLVYEA